MSHKFAWNVRLKCPAALQALVAFFSAFLGLPTVAEPKDAVASRCCWRRGRKTTRLDQDAQDL